MSEVVLKWEFRQIGDVTWVLGTKPESFVRVTSAFNHWIFVFKVDVY